MRVISGLLKGRSINFIKNSTTRPLKDKVKENIFNILKHSNLIEIKILDANILDLYSGIGSFGIECISRGASKVTFIEQNTQAQEMLKNNLIKLSIFNKTTVYNDKIENYLDKNLVEKFHIFFFDPPFSDLSFIQNLLKIKKKKLYEKNHTIIIHRERKTKDKLQDILDIIEIKEYGRSKIIFAKFK